MRELARMLEQRFNRKGWSFTRPGQGHQGDCYIVQSGDLKLFLKLGIDNSQVLHILSNLDVAPQFIASGIVKSQPYTIQDFYEGKNPSPAWFGDHLGYLAEFIRRYHNHKYLARLLSLRQDPTELVAGDLALLETRFNRLKEARKWDLDEIEPDFAKLKRDGLNLAPVELVPVHAEPNTSNMLLMDDRLFMIDWDEIRLGDPVQDVGQILWWYVPPARWAEFFESYGLPLTEDILKRIYWWAAKASLSIAFWQFEHGFDGRDFLHDFQAAVHDQPNPRA